MIKVVVNEKVIMVSGHANYGNYGKDIVCASVSSIITTSINAIIALNKEAICYSDDNKKMVIKKLSDDKTTAKLLKNMVRLLKNLSKDYPKNISVIEMRDKK